MTRHIAINGRFLTRPASGVDRVAIELIVAMAGRVDVDRLTLLHPATVGLHTKWLDQLPIERRAKIVLQPLGSHKGHLWEQLDLARAMPDLPLLNLCSTGPAFRWNQVVIIHDAQVWDVPQSYSRAFRLAYRLLLPQLARRARHVLTVSHFSAQRLIDLGITPNRKPCVMLNGADHILRLAPDADVLVRHRLAAKGYILAIGSLAPHKNLRLLVEAAQARLGQPPELIIAGGMDSKVFSDARLSVTGRIRCIGRVNDAELRALYQGALALTFPSLTEGFGLPPVEAMLCGCPVIATTGGAVPEVCGDAVLFVAPDDRAGWTTAMDRVAGDASLCADLTRKGLIRSSQYTWDRAANVLLEQVYFKDRKP